MYIKYQYTTFVYKFAKFIDIAFFLRLRTIYVTETETMASDQDIESCSSHDSSTISASETEDILIQMSDSDIEPVKAEFKGRLALINKPAKKRF